MSQLNNQTVNKMGSNFQPQPTGRWTCCTDPNGKTFYFNPIINKSTYTCPEELKSTPNIWSKQADENGKIYYFNHETNKTQWNVPNNYIENNINTVESHTQPLKYSENKKNKTQTKETDEKLKTPKKKKSKTVNASDINNFTNIFEDMDLKSDSKWSEILPAIINDERYPLIKTHAQRKNIFEEWKEKKKSMEENEEMEKVDKKKKGFYEMLKENNKISYKSTIKSVEKLCRKDKRYKAIYDKEARFKIIDEYIRDLKNKKNKERKLKKIKHMDELDSFIRGHKDITLDTSWKETYKIIKKKEFCKHLEKNEMRIVFDEYIADMEKERISETQLKKMEMKKIQEKQRNKFRELLKELFEEGKYFTKTKFYMVKPLIKGDKRYKAILNQSLSVETIYKDYCEDLDELMVSDKQILRKFINNNKIKITTKDSDEDILKRIYSLNSQSIKDMSKANVRAIIKLILYKKKMKEAERIKKNYNIFSNLLNDLRVNQILSWEEVSKRLSSYKIFHKLPESVRKKAFDIYMEKVVKENKELSKEIENDRKPLSFSLRQKLNGNVKTDEIIPDNENKKRKKNDKKQKRKKRSISSESESNESSSESKSEKQIKKKSKIDKKNDNKKDLNKKKTDSSDETVESKSTSSSKEKIKKSKKISDNHLVNNSSSVDSESSKDVKKSSDSSESQKTKKRESINISSSESDSSNKKIKKENNDEEKMSSDSEVITEKNKNTRDFTDSEEIGKEKNEIKKNKSKSSSSKDSYTSSRSSSKDSSKLSKDHKKSVSRSSSTISSRSDKRRERKLSTDSSSTNRDGMNKSKWDHDRYYETKSTSGENTGKSSSRSNSSMSSSKDSRASGIDGNKYERFRPKKHSDMSSKSVNKDKSSSSSSSDQKEKIEENCDVQGENDI